MNPTAGFYNTEIFIFIINEYNLTSDKKSIHKQLKLHFLMQIIGTQKLSLIPLVQLTLPQKETQTRFDRS